MSDETPTLEESHVRRNRKPSSRHPPGQVENLTAQLQTLRFERDEFSNAMPEIATERDSLRAKPEPSARITELEASIRDRNHLDKFAELAWRRRPRPRRSGSSGARRTAATRPRPKRSTRRPSRTSWRRLKTEVDYAFDPEADTTPRPPGRPPGQPVRTKYGLEMRGEEQAGGRRPIRTEQGRGRHHRHPGDAGRSQVHAGPPQPRADRRCGKGEVPMKIDAVIQQLAAIHQLHGDLPVYKVITASICRSSSCPGWPIRSAVPGPANYVVVFGTLASPVPVI